MQKPLLMALAVTFLASSTCFSQDTISFEKALTIAQADAKATLIYGRAESKATGNVWGFYFLLPNEKIIEKEVSMSGRILVSKTIDDITEKGKIDTKVVQALKDRAPAKLSNSRYLEIAKDQGKGQLNGMEVFLMGDDLQVKVSGQSPDGKFVVTMDMVTGKVKNIGGSK